MGRLSLPGLSRRRQGRAAVEIRPAADALLSRAGRGGARSSRRSASCSTARSSCRRQRRVLVRRPAAAHPSGREPRAEARGETPALLIVFDLLVDADGKPLTGQPLHERRRAAGSIRREILSSSTAASASRPRPPSSARPRTGSSASAPRSTASSPSAATSPIARATAPACRRSRTTAAPTAWSAASATTKASGSSARCCSGSTTTSGLLHHVGFTSTHQDGEDKPALTKKLEKLIAPPGFTGNAPGGPSRWSTKRIGRVAAAQAEAGGRGLLRPFHRRALPPRHAADALAAGQGAAAMHDGSGEAEESEPDEAAEVSLPQLPARRIGAHRVPTVPPRSLPIERTIHYWSMIFSENRCPLFGIML